MRSKSKIVAAIVLTMMVCLICAFGVVGTVAEENELTATPRGLFTQISVSLWGNHMRTVTATAKNEFTLGFSTIPAYVYLYWSPTRVTDISYMQRVATGYTADLNMGDSINASDDTELKDAYWAAVVRYKFDDNDWTEKSTEIVRFDANANLIG